MFNPIALGMTKTPLSSGYSECSWGKYACNFFLNKKCTSTLVVGLPLEEYISRAKHSRRINSYEKFGTQFYKSSHTYTKVQEMRRIFQTILILAQSDVFISFY